MWCVRANEQMDECVHLMDTNVYDIYAVAVGGVIVLYALLPILSNKKHTHTYNDGGDDYL